MQSDVEYSEQDGTYQLVGDWVFLHLELEFRNRDPDTSQEAVAVLPPFRPVESSVVYFGSVSGLYSEIEGSSFTSVELSLVADGDAAILVSGHSDSTTLPGGTPVLLGLDQTRRIVGSIAYRTTGEYLY